MLGLILILLGESEKMAENTAQKGISVVCAYKEQVRSNMRGPVTRSVYIIECCTEGKGSVIINGKEFPFSAGACYALLPGDSVQHTADKTASRKGFWCALDGADVGVYLKQTGITSRQPFFSADIFPEVQDWLEKMVLAWNSQDPGAQLRQTACALGLMGTILKNNPAQKKGSLAEKAIAFMWENISRPLDVAEIAAHVGLERSYFSEAFKEKTGISPHRYLLKLRLQRACQLLDVLGYAVADIADMVGLEPHNFARIFKKEIGLSPVEYRKSSKSDATRVRARTQGEGKK